MTVKAILKLYGFTDLLPNAVSRAIRANLNASGHSIAQTAPLKSPRPARLLKIYLWRQLWGQPLIRLKTLVLAR